MANPYSAGFPAAPLTEPASGAITPVWRAFLLALYSRTGAAIGVSAGSIATALSAETAARAAEDILLGNSMASETAARLAADRAEATARQAADAALAVSLAITTFVFHQATPSARWTITHHLGRFPSIEVADSSGRIVEGDVTYVSSRQMTVAFTAAFSGVAYLN